MALEGRSIPDRSASHNEAGVEIQLLIVLYFAFDFNSRVLFR